MTAPITRKKAYSLVNDFAAITGDVVEELKRLRTESSALRSALYAIRVGSESPYVSKKELGREAEIALKATSFPSSTERIYEMGVRADHKMVAFGCWKDAEWMNSEGVDND